MNRSLTAAPAVTALLFLIACIGITDETWFVPQSTGAFFPRHSDRTTP
jgi:hypothetical protein